MCVSEKLFIGKGTNNMIMLKLRIPFENFIPLYVFAGQILFVL